MKKNILITAIILIVIGLISCASYERDNALDPGATTTGDTLPLIMDTSIVLQQGILPMLHIEWTANGSFSSYKVYSSTDDATFSEIANSITNNYWNYSSTVGGMTYFKVTGVNSQGAESILSDTQSISAFYYNGYYRDFDDGNGIDDFLAAASINRSISNGALVLNWNTMDDNTSLTLTNIINSGIFNMEFDIKYNYGQGTVDFDIGKFGPNSVIKTRLRDNMGGCTFENGYENAGIMYQSLEITAALPINGKFKIQYNFDTDTLKFFKNNSELPGPFNVYGDGTSYSTLTGVNMFSFYGSASISNIILELDNIKIWSEN